ncbi:MAG: hypothetical protein GY854_05580 [Deltaproteobacteria bacterium]|nr:hypothetical protein [Deltaproteobacteria bacterium]
MKKTKDKNAQAKQALYKALFENSERDSVKYQKSRAMPLEIPGKLALHLDDLLDLAEKENGQKNEDALSDVIELGIAAWYGRLDSEDLTRLGLPTLDLDPDPAQAQAQPQPYQAGSYTPLTSHTLSLNPNPTREMKTDTSKENRRRGSQARKRRRR